MNVKKKKKERGEEKEFPEAVVCGRESTVDRF